jgi:hypothetical protein
MTDEDIRAFRSAPVHPAPPTRGRRLWPWLLLALLLLTLIAAGSLVAMVQAVSDFSGDGVNITVNGESVQLGTLHGGHALLAVGGVMFAVLLVLLIVPVIVLLALLAAAVGVGVALLAVVLVAGIALSPLLLLAMLVWWAVRPRRPAPALAR